MSNFIKFVAGEYWVTTIADDASDGKKYYYAATAQNAYYEYRGYANQDNIPVLSDQLEILIVGVNESASTPMFQHIGNAVFMYDLIFDYLTGWQDFLARLGLGLGGSYAETYVAAAPDMFYGYGAETVANNGARSDRIKETFYHEYAHVSHYSVVSDDYWRDNIEYVVNNDKTNNNPPYGTAITPGAGRTAVIEMWGEHYGKTLAYRQYELQHSNTTSTDMNTRILERRLYILERFVPNGSGFPNVVDAADSWIPYGVLYDCLDDNTLNPFNVVEPAVVMDGVKGYTQASFFSSITNAQNIMTVRDNLRSTVPIGQTAEAVDALFLSYGY